MSDAPLLAWLRLDGEAATETLAAALAGRARAGTVILLSGGLGAGKSTFARAFIRSLTSPTEEVPSPTFTLVQQYGPVSHGGEALEIWHTDLYRLGDPDEVLELGLDEAFESAVCLVEWPDRLGPFRPVGAIELEISLPPEEDSAETVRLAALRLPAALKDDYADALAGARLEAEWS